MPGSAHVVFVWMGPLISAVDGSLIRAGMWRHAISFSNITDNHKRALDWVRAFSNSEGERPNYWIAQVTPRTAIDLHGREFTDQEMHENFGDEVAA